jgi:peptide-methionine (S)-S-oxide reductase
MLRLTTLAVIPLAALLLVPRPVATGAKETVVLAGGCYWGVEAVFEHVKGTKVVTSGFATPASAAPEPATGIDKGYAEAVQIVYDPAQVSLKQILHVFFLIAHDPTEVDRQGPDIGPQYRSVVFFSDEKQLTVVQEYLAQLRSTNAYSKPIATELVPLKRFRMADASQQDFVERNSGMPYVQLIDAPKVEALRRQFPALYRD